jgi:hypothetical protein
MSRFSKKKGISIATPLMFFTDSCRQIINSIVDAIKKLPHIKVAGNKRSTALNSVMAPNNLIPSLLKFHLPNRVIISGLPLSIAQPCLSPIYITNSIISELIILIAIVLIIKPIAGELSLPCYWLLLNP